ncbi:GRP family sugar transporter [Listeria valentina]|uniref:GRP family sugar transporter n=1 Tax=Listeria valentina TaxID=2705293 RepID=UPI0014313AD4|nr:GRP family sugar transporter [Listeria valentina]
MNVLIALLPAIGWGIQPLILRKIGGKPSNEIFGTGIGALIAGIVVTAIFSPHLVATNVFILSLLSGLFWVMGQTGQYHAFGLIGVSKTMPISTGFQLVGTSLIGVILFGEWPGALSKIIGFLAILLLIIGVLFTSVSDNTQNRTETKRGIFVLAATSLGYWVYSALPKAVSASGLAIFLPQMLGVFIGAVLYACINNKRVFREEKSWKAVIVGLIFGLSALAYIFSAQKNGVATAYIITQLNVVISTIGGIVILKESKSGRALKETIFGLLLIVIGSVITVLI